MFDHLSNLLKKKFSRKDSLSQNLAITKILQIYNQEIQKKFPRDKQTRAVILKNNTLTVKTTSSVRASELRFVESEMIGKINQQLMEEKVKKIIYRY